MPFSFSYVERLRKLHDRINEWKATTSTTNGRKYVRIMNKMRYLLAYSIIRG